MGVPSRRVSTRAIKRPGAVLVMTAMSLTMTMV